MEDLANKLDWLLSQMKTCEEKSLREYVGEMVLDSFQDNMTYEEMKAVYKTIGEIIEKKVEERESELIDDIADQKYQEWKERE